jgi:hypothetical protein
MGIIAKLTTFVTRGGVLDPAKVDANFDQLFTLVNGLLDAANIADGVITDDLLAASVSPVKRWSDSFQDYVVTGLTVTASGLACTVGSGKGYVSGFYIEPSASGHTVSDNTTSYCDVSSSGTFSWNSNATPASNYLRLAKIVAATGTCTITDLRNLSPIGKAEIEAKAIWDVESAKVATTPSTTIVNTPAVLLTVTMDNVKNGDTLFLVLSGSFSQATGAAVVNFKFAAGGTPLADEYPLDLPVTVSNRIITLTNLYAVTADAATLVIDIDWRTSAATTSAAIGTGLYVFRLRQTG